MSLFSSECLRRLRYITCKLPIDYQPLTSIVLAHQSNLIVCYTNPEQHLKLANCTYDKYYQQRVCMGLDCSQDVDRRQNKAVYIDVESIQYMYLPIVSKHKQVFRICQYQVNFRLAKAPTSQESGLNIETYYQELTGTKETFTIILGSQGTNTWHRSAIRD